MSGGGERDAGYGGGERSAGCGGEGRGVGCGGEGRGEKKWEDVLVMQVTKQVQVVRHIDCFGALIR